jgi:negative regulator of flagellin synthesis FlgM
VPKDQDKTLNFGKIRPIYQNRNEDTITMSYSPRIDQTQPLHPTQPTAVQKTAEKLPAQAVEPDAAQTSLSSTSTYLAAALATSDVRMEKVASLQQAIAAGTYNVSSADVAEKIITSQLV